MPTSNQPSTKPSRPQAQVQRRSNITLIVISIVSFLGFADASYLTADHFFKLPLPCSFTSGCDTVLTSRFATVDGIPIALFGVLYYLAVLFCAIYLYTSDQKNIRVARLMLLITTIGFITTSYLFYLQADVIHAFCMYCLGSATATLLLFIASIVLMRSLRKS